MAVQRFQDWQAAHPDIVVDGNPVGKWMTYKPCLKKARRFASYYVAHQAALNRQACRCRQVHFIVELESAEDLRRALRSEWEPWLIETESPAEGETKDADAPSDLL